MKDLEQKTTDDLEVSLAVGYAEPNVKRVQLLKKHYKFLGFLGSCLFMFAAIFIYKASLKPSDVEPAPQLPSYIAPKTIAEKITIEKGQTIGKLLSNYGLSHNNIIAILKSTSSHKIDLVKLKPGQVIEITYATHPSGSKVLSHLTIQLESTSKLQVTRDPADNSFKATIIPIVLIKDFRGFSGKIKNNLMVSAIHAGVPISNLIEATNASLYEIDFQREVKDGDSFRILVEKFTSKDDGSVSFGKTVFFSLKLKGKEYKLYKFKPLKAKEEFFTAQLQSAKRGLLRTPVSMTRISSRFGMRKHPILGYSLMHKGVDFAAPQGASIYSAGDGVVSQMGRNVISGNYMKIRHNAKLTTVYCHISRFAKASKPGTRVTQGQVIAFVGETGRATAPHLHYEILLNGRHVDPLKFKLPSITMLKGKDAESFKSHKAHIDSLFGPALFS